MCFVGYENDIPFFLVPPKCFSCDLLDNNQCAARTSWEVVLDWECFVVDWYLSCHVVCITDCNIKLQMMWLIFRPTGNLHIFYQNSKLCMFCTLAFSCLLNILINLMIFSAIGYKVILSFHRIWPILFPKSAQKVPLEQILCGPADFL